MIPNACWLRPVRFTATGYALRATINGTTETLAFPAVGQPALDPALDYWVSGDSQTGAEASGTGRVDLVYQLQLCLAQHTFGAAVNVNMDPDTGIVQVAHGGALSMKLLWSAGATTLDATIFGWTAGVDSSLGTIVYGPLPARGLILWGRPATRDTRDYQPVVGGIATSLSGKTRSSRMSLGAKVRDWIFELIHQTRAREEFGVATYGAGVVETAWLDALSLGYPFRVYARSSDIAAPTYRVYRLRSLDEPFERSTEDGTRWTVTFQAVLEVVV